MKEERTAQVRVKAGNVVMGSYSEGAVLFMTPSMARKLHEMNAVEIIGARPPDDALSKALAETSSADFVPVGEISIPKSSDTPPNGPSTGSVSSSEDGKGERFSALEEGQASASNSTKEFSNASDSSASATGAESSPSTTPISSAPTQTSSTSPTGDGGNGTETEQSSASSGARSARSRTRAIR